MAVLDTVTPNLGFTLPGVDGPAQVLELEANWTKADALLGAVVNVRWPRFGAVGDGVADDTAAIQAAIAAVLAVGGGVVYLPTGTYRTTATLTLASPVGVTLTGPRSARLLPVVGNTQAISVTNGAGVVIEGFTISASGSGQAAIGVAVYASSDVHVRNMAVTGVRRVMAPAGAGILLSGCTESSVEGCYCGLNGFGANNATASVDILLDASCVRCDVRGCHAVSSDVTMNIGVQDSTWCAVVGNTAGGAVAKPDTTAWGYGIYTYGTAGTTPVVHCVVADNLVFATGGMGIYLQTTSFTAVTGNVVYDTCKTITSAGGLALGAIAANSLCADLVIATNTIDTGVRGIRFDCPRTQVLGNALRSLTSVAIAINGVVDQSVVAHNVMTSCVAGILTLSVGLGITGLTVAHNTVNGTTGSNAGIGLDDVDQLSLLGNLCRACSGYGITLSNCTGGEVASNTCLSNNGVGAAFDGIAISSNCTTLNVHDNRSTGASQVYGLNLAGSGHSVHDNQLAGNGTGGVTSIATATVLRDNRVSTGAAQGVATLTAGTVTVATAEILAGDSVLLVRKTLGGTVGHLDLGAIVAGTSFVIHSSSATETSTVYWEIVH